MKNQLSEAKRWYDDGGTIVELCQNFLKKKGVKLA